MSQDIFPDINPTVTSGTQLATLLNQFKAAMMSQCKGPSRPTAILPGGVWIDDSLEGSPDFTWTLKLYDGTDDIVLMSINVNTNTVYIDSLATGEFEIIQVSDDAVGPELVLRKKRIATSGQVQTNDIIGLLNFISTDNTGSPVEEAASIEVSATQNHTSANQGSRIKINVKKTGESTKTTQITIDDEMTVVPPTSFQGAVTFQGGASGTPLRGSAVQGVDISSPGTVSSSTITTEMSGKSESTSSTEKGVPTSAPYNKVIIRNASGTEEDDKMYDVSGNEVYGRITKAGSVWTLSYYTKISATETAHTLTAAQSSAGVRWYFQELFNPLLDLPVYDPIFQVPSENATADIIDASDTKAGKVSTGTQKFAGEKTFENPVTLKESTTPTNPAANYLKLYPKSDGFLYSLNPAGQEKRIGTGGGGVENILGDAGDPTLGTGGWDLDSVSAATRPGGSLNGTTAGITMSTTTSDPINGEAGFTISKDGSNRQGQLALCNMPIVPGNRAAVLSIRMKYKVLSGTFTAGAPGSDSSLIVYIREYNGSVYTWKEPSSFKLLSNSTTLVDEFMAEFQTNYDTISAELVLYVPVTSTVAFSVEFLPVVSPSQYTFGTPITDWQQYTPVFNGVGTVSNVNIRWRQVGDSMDIVGRFTTGTPTSSGGYFTLPTGKTLDDVKVTDWSYFGDWIRNTAAGSTRKRGKILVEDNIVYFTNDDYSTAVGSASIINGDNLFGSTELVNVQITGVPIKGWSSSVQIASETTTRVICAKYANTAAQSIANDGMTVMQATSISGTGGISVAPTGICTVEIAGYYTIRGRANFVANATGLRYSRIVKNSTTVIAAGRMVTASSSNLLLNATDAFAQEYFKAGETFQFEVYQNSGGALSLESSGPEFNFVSVCRESGPNQIAASELVMSTAVGDPATATAGNPFIFPTIRKNTHGSYSNTTGRFSVTLTGTYEVNLIGAGTSGDSAGTIYWYKNGVIGDVVGAFAGNTSPLNVYGTIEAVAGDIIDVRPNTSINLTGGSITFKRLGF